jgi:hypothetical protein
MADLGNRLGTNYGVLWYLKGFTKNGERRSKLVRMRTLPVDYYLNRVAKPASRERALPPGAPRSKDFESLI